MLVLSHQALNLPLISATVICGGRLSRSVTRVKLSINNDVIGESSLSENFPSRTNSDSAVDASQLNFVLVDGVVKECFPFQLDRSDAYFVTVSEMLSQLGS